MNRQNLRAGEPIRNLQHFLRYISYHHSGVPAVIPDGIFSSQTQESVSGFQKTFNLPETGIVDADTWYKIISIYEEIIKNEEELRTLNVFPEENFLIKEQDTHHIMYLIQSMLQVLTSVFNNIGKINISGTHDELSVNTVKLLQDLFDIEATGIIDKKTFNLISALYELTLI